MLAAFGWPSLGFAAPRVQELRGTDFDLVIGEVQVNFTGRKWEQKVHFRSSNRPGGITATPVAKLRKENPAQILVHAVKYMLPKNKTQIERLKRLTFV